jgi:hypothetical protein
MKSGAIDLKSPEFNLLLQGKEEIIASKKEQIEHMKEMYTEILKSKDEMLKSKDEELKEVRTALDTVVKQNETLAHQNVFLTRLLTGPKEERAEQEDDVISPDFKDVRNVTTETEESVPESHPAAENEASQTHEQPAMATADEDAEGSLHMSEGAAAPA